jgi:hypothetical protein
LTKAGRFGARPPLIDEDAGEKPVPAEVLPTQRCQLLRVTILTGAVIAGLIWYRH